MSNVEISQEILVESVTFLDQFLTSRLPTYDFSQGTANRDIAINSIALVIAYLRQDINTIKNGLTLFDLKDKTDDSSNEMVDSILSDFFVERHTGDQASGPVSLFFSTNLIGTVTIRNTDIFVKNEVEYRIPADILFITPSDLQKNTSNTGVTFYTYSLTLQAVEKGIEGKAVQGIFSDWQVNSPFLYRVEVLEDFGGGEDIEASGDLIVRSEKALTVKNLVTDNAIFTVLMENFAFLRNIVSIGMHEPEMIRDLITFSSGVTNTTLHRGSMIDIYGKFPIAFRAVLTGTVVSVSINEVTKSAIQISNVPVYKVHSVIDTANNNAVIPFVVEIDNPSLYLSGRQGFYITMSEDFLGSPLQVTYDFTTNYQEVQNFVSAKSERTVNADSLVKAQFPLYLSFDMPVYSSTEITAANLIAVKNSIQTYIHSGEVEGNLYVSTLIDHVTMNFNYIVQLPLVVTGKLLLPNGKVMTIPFSDRIRTPEKFLIDNFGNYLPFFDGEANTNNYVVGTMASLQISDTTTRYVLDKNDITIRRVS